MTERFADLVTVPDVVGLPFHVARDIANDAGVALANPDPDGAPISALTWPGLFSITSQRPEAGALLYRWDSVAVEVSPSGTAEQGAGRDDTDPPSSDSAHAVPERDQYVDLTDE